MPNTLSNENVLNRSDIIEIMCEKRPDLGRLLIDESVKEIVNLMVDTLVEERRVEIRGFGSFALHKRSPRKGRNPKTGESLMVAEKAVPHFKPGKILREAVDKSVSN